MTKASTPGFPTGISPELEWQLLSTAYPFKGVYLDADLLKVE